MRTSKSAPQIRGSGNLRGTEKIVTMNFRRVILYLETFTVSP